MRQHRRLMRRRRRWRGEVCDRAEVIQCDDMRRRRYWRGVFGNCGVGVTPQMCNRVTNHGDMVTFSRLESRGVETLTMVELHGSLQLLLPTAISTVSVFQCFMFVELLKYFNGYFMMI